MLDTSKHADRALAGILGAYRAFSPPSARTVAEGAAASLIIKQPGLAGRPWSAAETPYMVEPANLVTSRQHEACIFVGPARTGKTAGLLLAPMVHTVLHDPGDILFIQMTQDKAREFSKTDIRRAIDYSPDVLAALSGSSADRNTHDIMFRNGVWLRIAWPTISNVSGATYRYGFITDYDRIENADNVDGEGPLFDLVRKRVATFMSRGFALAESSPGIEAQDPHWKPATAHEAPPITGIVGLYNRGDRRQWYWRCPHCAEFHAAAPGLGMFGLPKEAELEEVIQAENLAKMAAHYSARIICPMNGCLIESSHKPAMNRGGIWVPDGGIVTPSGAVEHDGPPSKIASYWLGGVAAAFQTWESLVLRYLQAFRDYKMTGDPEALKSTVTLDQGAVFLPPSLAENARSGPEAPTDNTLQRFIVPPWVRFLIATVDVQSGMLGRFEVEVRGFGPHRESVLVDRFALTTVGQDAEALRVDPAAHPEHWDLLNEKVVRATYRLEDGREMRILRTGVDTGGSAGVTHNAYAWYRRLRRDGLAGSVRLLKGGSHAQDKPMVKGHARDNKNQPMPDMPIWLIDTDHYKDVIAASLRRAVPGPGYFHRSGWLTKDYWDGVRAEIRDAKGRWKKIGARRNEPLDLWTYAEALCEELGCGSKGRMNWDSPPEWALPQSDANSHIITTEHRKSEGSLWSGLAKSARFGSASAR